MSKAERLSLYNIKPVDNKFVTQTGEIFDAANYSRFKYGDKRVAAQYGYDLAELVTTKYERLLEEPTELVITSSAFKHIPTASHTIAVNLHAALNHNLYERGIEASESLKIHRHTLIEGDYGTMSEEERKRHMQRNRLHVDKERIEGSHLFVVDDVRITGSHERKIGEVLKDLDVLSVQFLYVVQMDMNAALEGPTVESRMNHAFVRDLDTLADIIATKQFLLNARTAKFVLKWENKGELKDFFASQDSDFLHTLYTGAVGDGYGFMKSYKDAMHVLRGELEQRELIRDGKLLPPAATK